MPRGPYKTISYVDRQRLIKAFENDKDWITLAENLGIKRQSARSIILKYRRTGEAGRRKRGGNRPQKIDDEMLSFMVNLIEQKPTITLKEIQSRMIIELPDKPPVTHQTISNKLDGVLYSVKDLRSVPVNWNHPTVKEERRQYTEWLMSNGLNNYKLFIDEFGVNIWTSRTKGRAPVGQRAIRVVEGQRGKNLTICLAISPEGGLVHWSTIVGGMTKDSFSAFLVELSQLMGSDQPYTALIDNARAHGDVPQMEDGHEVMFLPRYSPFLNACEMAGSCIKATLKRRLTESSVQREIYDRDAPRYETLHARRLRILRREVELSLPVITPQKCQQFFNHTLTYVPACTRGDDIFD